MHRESWGYWGSGVLAFADFVFVDVSFCLVLQVWVFGCLSCFSVLAFISLLIFGCGVLRLSGFWVLELRDSLSSGKAEFQHRELGLTAVVVSSHNDGKLRNTALGPGRLRNTDLGPRMLKHSSETVAPKTFC